MSPGKRFLVVGRHKGKRKDDRFYYNAEHEFDTYEEANTFIGIESMQMEGDGIEFVIVEVVE